MNIKIFTSLCYCLLFLVACNSPSRKTIKVEPVKISYDVKVKKKNDYKQKNQYVSELTSRLSDHVLSKPGLLMEGSLLYYKEKKSWPKKIHDFYQLKNQPIFLDKIKKASFEKAIFTTIKGGSLKIDYVINTKNNNLNGSIVLEPPRFDGRKIQTHQPKKEYLDP